METNLLAKKIRRRILKSSYESGACHIGSALSTVEILITLYFKVMKPEDIFIFSKASGVAALYSILAEKGIIPEEKVAYYLKKYPLPNQKVPGIEISAGSLGLVLSVAVGRALGKKLKREKGKVYVLLSDGELQEGNVWEALWFASKHRLNNLIVIIDWNFLQAFGSVAEISTLIPEKMFDIFGALNWYGMIIDGHNSNDLEMALRNNLTMWPKFVICETIKGKGCSFMESEVSWHYKNLNQELYEKAIRQNS